MNRFWPPYADALGVRMEEGTGNAPLVCLPFGPHVLGRPGFVHGGAIAGLLELAAYAAVHAALGKDHGATLKPINVTIDFMRGGREQDSWAIGHVSRLGNRIANVTAEAWQADRTKLIAAARINLKIERG
jgi:uncharacterized protein (TIGR00369 family)